MNEQTTLENAIGKTIRVFTKEQTPPCPPNGYLGILLEVNQKKSITVNCKLGYTNQDKALSFDGEDCKITKILIEESKETLYEQ